MKRIVLVLAVFLTAFSLGVQAQVTIGAESDPHSGAVLDLSHASGINGLGFLLPRVSLNDVKVWQIDGNAANGTGMVVYNTNPDVVDGNGKGIYVWDGSAWSSVKSSVVADVKVTGFDVSPSNTNVDLWVGGSLTFNVSGFIPGGASYQGVTWTISSGQSSVNISASTMTSCTVQGLAEGDATLTIRSLDENYTRMVTLHVKPVTVQSFTISPANMSILAGNTGTVTASNFVGSDENPLSGVTAFWTASAGTTTPGLVTNGSNSTTVSVDAGASAGNFTVTATAGGVTRHCTVTVLLPGDFGVPNGTTSNPSLSGITCFDVSADQGDPGTQQYVLTEGGSKVIQSVVWGVTLSTAGLLQSYSSGGANNATQTLVFKTRAELSAVAATAQTVTLTAYITYTDATKVQVSQTIKIQNKACCPGYLISGGVFTSPPAATTGSPSATLALGNSTGEDLCVGPDLGHSITWNTASGVNWCNTQVHGKGGDWDDGSNTWRLPNIVELANMHTYKASIPGLATSGYYRSSTDHSSYSSDALLWGFNGSGGTYTNSKTASGTTEYTRCVRTIN